MTNRGLTKDQKNNKRQRVKEKAKQAERLKSRERRTKVDRLNGQWVQWLIGSLDRICLMVNRDDG